MSETRINGIVLNRLGTKDQYVQVTLVVQTCIDCGVIFALSSAYDARRREDHKSFACPNGHMQFYTDRSEAEKLREQLKAHEDAHRRALDMVAEVRTDLAVERKAHGATKGKLTRTLKRANAGVCQHCHRTFSNVAKHMEAKHPQVGHEVQA